MPWESVSAACLGFFSFPLASCLLPRSSTAPWMPHGETSGACCVCFQAQVPESPFHSHSVSGVLEVPRPAQLPCVLCRVTLALLSCYTLSTCSVLPGRRSTVSSQTQGFHFCPCLCRLISDSFWSSSCSLVSCPGDSHILLWAAASFCVGAAVWVAAAPTVSGGPWLGMVRKTSGPSPAGPQDLPRRWHNPTL